MRARRAALPAGFVALLAGAALAIAASGGGAGSAYRVRAIFDNANFIIPGEDVKVAGVRVGVVDSLDLTRSHKAVVVLRIDDPAFRPFRADAHCSIRPQSLIGEQFVECSPTGAHRDGALPPPLSRVTQGRGRGQYLLRVTNTTTPVGLDLIEDIARLPYRQRLTLIINDLGAGLAGNGRSLRQAIRRASPALAQTDRVLAVLATQNRTLARLVSDSDTVVGPLANRRRQVADFIEQAGTTADAVAARGDDLERTLSLLPPFLRQLTPTARRLGDLADQMSPALDSLHPHARQLDRFVAGLGPFAAAATPALRTLGHAAQVGRRALRVSRPLISDLAGLGSDLRPLAVNAGALATSFRFQGGVEDVMRFIYFYTASINGLDRLGHYMRVEVSVDNCSSYTAVASLDCAANFQPGPGAVNGDHSPGSALFDYLLGP